MSENALIVLDGKPPIEFFVDRGLDPVIEKIKAEIAKFSPDISTEKGRKEIASMARKVASSKVMIDDMGKELVAALKVQTSAIDAERKRMRDELDRLRDETRQPLTDWEEKEEARQAGHRRVIETIEALLVFQGQPDAINIQMRLDQLHIIMQLRDWQEFKIVADNISHKVSTALQEKHDYVKKLEEERAELARLKAAEQERLARERDEKLRADAAAAAKAEAEVLARAEAEKAELERQAIERERIAAVERAEKAEADRQAAEERARADAVEAEARAQREVDAAVERERARVQEENRLLQEAAAARLRDMAHRSRINNEALGAFITECNSETVDLAPEIARAVVEAIARGKIPHVTINY